MLLIPIALFCCCKFEIIRLNQHRSHHAAITDPWHGPRHLPEVLTPGYECYLPIFQISIIGFETRHFLCISYHLPNLNNVIFGSTSKHPRLYRVPTKVRDFVGMATVNKLKQTLVTIKDDDSHITGFWQLTKSSGGPSSASSVDKSSPILAKSQTLILLSLPAVASTLS